MSSLVRQIWSILTQEILNGFLDYRSPEICICCCALWVNKKVILLIYFYVGDISWFWRSTKHDAENPATGWCFPCSLLQADSRGTQSETVCNFVKVVFEFQQLWRMKLIRHNYSSEPPSFFLVVSPTRSCEAFVLSSFFLTVWASEEIQLMRFVKIMNLLKKPWP